MLYGLNNPFFVKNKVQTPTCGAILPVMTKSARKVCSFCIHLVICRFCQDSNLGTFDYIQFQFIIIYFTLYRYSSSCCWRACARVYAPLPSLVVEGLPDIVRERWQQQENNPGSQSTPWKMANPHTQAPEVPWTGG